MRALWPIALIVASGCAAPEGRWHVVTAGPFEATLIERGSLGSAREVPLAAPYAGKLDTLVAEGTVVKPGDTVATLDTESQSERHDRAALDLAQKRLELPINEEKAKFAIWKAAREVENAEADLQIAKLKFHQLKVGRAGVDIVEAAETIGTLEAERAIAKDTLPEAVALEAKGYMAPQELKRMRARLAEIEAELKAARAKLAVLEAGPRREEIAIERLKVEAAASALAGAKKRHKAARIGGELDVEAARRELERALERERYQAADVERGTLKAPVAGVVIHQAVWTGAEMSKLKAGDTLGDGATLLVISDPSQQVVKARVGDATAARLKLGMPVRCTFDAYRDVAVTGTLKAIAPVAAPRLNGDVNEIPSTEVQVALDRPEPRLRPGMSANLAFVLASEAKVLTVPNEALHDGTVEVQGAGRRQLVLGPANERFTVVRSGLEAGDRVRLGGPR